MAKRVQPADLGFFSALARAGSLGAAGRELGISTAAVSKHLAQMEARLGAILFRYVAPESADAAGAAVRRDGAR
jgi:DNA-binding transcriptional LysR family regulator